MNDKRRTSRRAQCTELVSISDGTQQDQVAETVFFFTHCFDDRGDFFSFRVVEDAARAEKLTVLNLDVRASQERAIQVYEQLGFNRLGEIMGR